MKKIEQGTVTQLLLGIAEAISNGFKSHPLPSHVETFKKAPAFIGWDHVQRGEPWGMCLRIVLDLPASIDEDTSLAVVKCLHTGKIPKELNYPSVAARPLKYECGCVASNGEYYRGTETYQDFPLSCPQHGKVVVCDVACLIKVSRMTTSGIY